jgi:hypothetical protein
LKVDATASAEAIAETGAEASATATAEASAEVQAQAQANASADANAHSSADADAYAQSGMESEVVRGSGAMGGLVSGGDVRRDPVPGAVVVFRLNRVELLNPDPSLSLHGCSLGGLIRLARALDVALPDITVIGTVPERVGWTTELSPAAARAARAAVDAVRGLLAGDPVTV